MPLAPLVGQKAPSIGFQEHFVRENKPNK